MATFVLVHGAWHGGWCWKRLRPLLRTAGHDVYAPSLTGAADRSHLLSSDINLDTYRQDIVNLIEYEELQDVVLVGHSAAGVVINLAAGKVPQRIRHLVYLDAAIVADGQSLFDTFPEQWREGMRNSAVDGWRMPPNPGMIDGFFASDCSEADREWLKEKVSDQPIGPYEQKADLRDVETITVPKTYIRCTKRAGGTRREQVEALGWEWRELDAGHDPMISQPRALADLLVELAG